MAFLGLEEVQAIGESLFEAEKSGRSIRLISTANPDMDMEDAYAIQKSLVNKKLADGRIIKGYKIGLTSRAMQKALGIDVPDSGVLFDNMFFDNCAKVPRGRFIEPRIEAEIAFFMKRNLKGANICSEEVSDATEYVAPALEILDTRFFPKDPDTGARRNVFDTICDNASNAGVVIGNKKHAVEKFDLRWVPALVFRNNEIEETGLGAGVLDSPITSIVWLIQRLNKYDLGLRKGDIVLSGSFTRPVVARSGDSFFADFKEFGSVRIDFE